MKIDEHGIGDEYLDDGGIFWNRRKLKGFIWPQPDETFVPERYEAAHWVFFGFSILGSLFGFATLATQPHTVHPNVIVGTLLLAVSYLLIWKFNGTNIWLSLFFALPIPLFPLFYALILEGFQDGVAAFIPIWLIGFVAICLYCREVVLDVVQLKARRDYVLWELQPERAMAHYFLANLFGTLSLNQAMKWIKTHFPEMCQEHLEECREELPGFITDFQDARLISFGWFVFACFLAVFVVVLEQLALTRFPTAPFVCSTVVAAAITFHALWLLLIESVSLGFGGLARRFASFTEFFVRYTTEAPFRDDMPGVYIPRIGNFLNRMVFAGGVVTLYAASLSIGSYGFAFPDSQFSWDKAHVSYADQYERKPLPPDELKFVQSELRRRPGAWIWSFEESPSNQPLSKLDLPYRMFLGSLLAHIVLPIVSIITVTYSLTARLLFEFDFLLSPMDEPNLTRLLGEDLAEQILEEEENE